MKSERVKTKFLVKGHLVVWLRFGFHLAETKLVYKLLINRIRGPFCNFGPPSFHFNFFCTRAVNQTEEKRQVSVAFSTARENDIYWIYLWTSSIKRKLLIRGMYSVEYE